MGSHPPWYRNRAATRLQDCPIRLLRRQRGARALRGMLEKLMLEIMYEAPGRDDIEGIRITRAAVEGKAKPRFRLKPKSAEAA